MNTLRSLWPDARPAPRPSCLAVGRCLLPAFVLSALLACGDGGTGPGSSVIGRKGGSASLAGGAVTLSVPGGVLATPVQFTAERTTEVPQSDALLGSAYEVGPAGITFPGLATLTLAYDPGSLPAGVGQADLRLQKVVGAGWQPTILSSVDSVRHVVTGRIESVGRFGVLGAAIPVAAVSLNPSRYTLAAGSTTRLYVSVTGPFGESLPYRRVTWTSADRAVATVDTAGVVSGVGGGGTTITASAGGHSATAALSVFDCSRQTSVPTKECAAVIAVYDGISQSQWRTGTYAWVPGTDPCRWAGVTCADGAVSVLDLHSVAYNLNGGPYPGGVPYAVRDLANLTRLDLSGNRLSGEIPPVIGTLTKLQVLALNSNQLSGPIPPELSTLSSLREMRLDNNRLSGPIPPELGNLTSIQVLYLGGNQLSGSIPRQLGGLATLQTLWLGANELSGAIPKELGSLSNLTNLALAYNQLSGSIPRELGSLSHLTVLQLDDNQLSGSIPAEIGNLSNLQMLFLAGNTLTGAVPLLVAQLGAKIQAQHVRSDCVLTPPGNTGLSMPDDQDFRAADLDADGLICGVRIGSP